MANSMALAYHSRATRSELMKTVRQDRNQVPTSSRPKVVASEGERSRMLRRFLAVLLRFARRKRALTVVPRHLSESVLSLHGFVGDEKGGIRRTDDGSVIAPLVAWLTQILGPELDTRRIQNAILQSSRLSDVEKRLRESYLTGGKERLEREFRELVIKLLNAWGAPHEFTDCFNLSLDHIPGLLRAFRATLFCLNLYNVHPLVLIARASEGNPQAVLDLIKVDKLFLHDKCTEKVIREAEVRNNQLFINSMARALEYEPRFTCRGARHSYFTVLFLLEGAGLMLPTLHELWRVLDPHGREYESLSSFERDFQRRRSAFNQVLATLDAEFPATRDN
jgi:hypothetical protein